MKWLDDIQVSLYDTHSDNIGRAATMRNVLLHPEPITFEILEEIRKLDKSWAEYEVFKKSLKALLQCYTPAALLATKAKGKMELIKRSGIMQLDFDYHDISDYDIEDLKQCVFNLPFIGYCGLSASGDGFYALALIAEPERLSEYAEHCFEVLDSYGIKADRSKGRKVENLRYVSWDDNMLIRENPEPLLIKRFHAKPKPVSRQHAASMYTFSKNTSGLTKYCANLISQATRGQRWATVQRAAFTLGGAGDEHLLQVLVDAIQSNSEFAGEEEKYIQCAEDCFKDGTLRPLETRQQYQEA